MGEEPAMKRCEHCELVYADIPENFSLGSMNRDVLSAWCRACARRARARRYDSQDSWEYATRFPRVRRMIPREHAAQPKEAA